MIVQHVEEAQKNLKKKESVTVILPQFVMKKKRFHALHNQTSMQLKLQLSKNGMSPSSVFPTLCEQWKLLNISESLV